MGKLHTHTHMHAHMHTHTHACTHTHTYPHIQNHRHTWVTHTDQNELGHQQNTFSTAVNTWLHHQNCLNTYLLLTGATNFYTHPKMYQESHLISFLGIYLSSVWAASTIFRFSYFVPIIIHGLIVTLTWRFLQTDATRETTRTTISLASGLSSLTCRLFISWSKSRVNLESASNHFICNCNF